MQHGPRIGQCLHHLSGATGVIEVDVRQEQVVDLLAGEAQLVERRQQLGRGRAGPGVDEAARPWSTTRWLAARPGRT